MQPRTLVQPFLSAAQRPDVSPAAPAQNLCSVRFCGCRTQTIYEKAQTPSASKNPASLSENSGIPDFGTQSRDTTVALFPLQQGTQKMACLLFTDASGSANHLQGRSHPPLSFSARYDPAAFSRILSPNEKRKLLVCQTPVCHEQYSGLFCQLVKHQTRLSLCPARLARRPYQHRPFSGLKKIFPLPRPKQTFRHQTNIPENASYIFSLCTLEPRKNLIFAVKAFAEFTALRQTENLYFVLGGASWKTFVPFLQREIGNLKDCKRFIILAGYVDDDDLAALYSDAFCFVYPSLYEGFGLPPLEAMQCGCPVIASDTSSLPEVIGDAGIMIDPRNEKSLVKAFTDLFDNPRLRRRLVQQSLRRARQFSWKTSADIIVRKIIND